MSQTFNETVKQETADLLRQNAGRISDYTLEKFFTNLWVNITGALFLCVVFFFYRNLRGDTANLQDKLNEKVSWRRNREQDEATMNKLSNIADKRPSVKSKR